MREISTLKCKHITSGEGVTSFPLFFFFYPQHSPKGGASEGCGQQDQDAKKLPGPGKRPPWEPECGESLYFFLFSLLQPCPEVCPRPGAAPRWSWWCRHQKPCKMTHHSEQREELGRGTLSSKGCRGTLSFILSFLSLLDPRKWSQAYTTEWQLGGWNSNRNLSLEP